MRAFTVLLALAWFTGCATPEKVPPLLPGEVRSARAASDALSIGKSSKADVRAALGQGTVIDFDSGYAVWLYREKPAKQASELALLFAPSGILAKARIR